MLSTLNFKMPANPVRFNFPTTIHLGWGVRSQIGPHLKALGFKRPLIVTDKGVAGLPMFDEMKKALGSVGLEVGAFSGIFGNPVKSQVTAGVEAFRQHKADCMIGLGGGAAIDVAKAILLMVNHPGDLFDYEDDLPGARPVDKAIPYWVAVPTTAGTGSEVGRSAVVSDDQTHVKKIIFSPKLLAQVVYADPELTVGLPAAITAATGMDALTHCVEAFLAKGYHPIADGIALEGIRLAAGSLVKAVREPKDRDARAAMLMASMMGAIAFQKGLGVTHSCAHALSTVNDLHHGLANGIMIDFALRHNLKAVPDRFVAMARAVGLNDATGEAFLGWLAGLKRETGIPEKLSAQGVKASDVEKLVAIAIKDACHPSNPEPCTAADFERIFKSAL